MMHLALLFTDEETVAACHLFVVSISGWWWRGGVRQHCQWRSAISSTPQCWSSVDHATGTTSCFYDSFCLRLKNNWALPFSS